MGNIGKRDKPITRAREQGVCWEIVSPRNIRSLYQNHEVLSTGLPKHELNRTTKDKLTWMWESPEDLILEIDYQQLSNAENGRNMDVTRISEK